MLIHCLFVFLVQVVILAPQIKASWLQQSNKVSCYRINVSITPNISMNMIQVNQSSTWFPYLQGPLGLIDSSLFPHWSEQLPILHIKDACVKWCSRVIFSFCVVLLWLVLHLCIFEIWERERERISSKNIIARVTSWVNPKKWFNHGMTSSFEWHHI